MKTKEYRKWLEAQRYQQNTITAQMHRAGRVEEFYGDLDVHYKSDYLASIVEELTYTTNDRRNNRPNQTKIPFEGNAYNNLASYKNATQRYKRFCDEEGDLIFHEVEANNVPKIKNDETEGQRISLERDMQAALRLNIEQLEEGLTIIDDGAERSVCSGFVDITARDSSGNIVVIELKTGIARQRAIAQISSYMGDILGEEEGNSVRGILVASEFDSKAKSAAKVVQDLSLRKYNVVFNFSII